MIDFLLNSHAWYELFRPIPLLLIFFCTYVYWTKVVRTSFYNVTRSQIAYFITAIILFYFVKGGPLSVIADTYLFSAHVTQLAMIMFVVAPLIILSIPIELYRSFFWNYRRRLIITLLSHPWVTAIAFNGLVTAYFVPSIFNILRENTFLLIVAQCVLIVHAFLMWWFIISPLPEANKFKNLAKIAFIFFSSVLLLPISFFLLVILKVHYPFYDNVAGQLVPALTTIYDQQLGGGILKITQLATYAYAMLKIMLHWGREEDEMEGQIEDKNIRYVQGVVIRLNDKNK